MHKLAPKSHLSKKQTQSKIIQPLFMKMHFDLSDPKVIDELFYKSNYKCILYAKSLIGNQEEARDIVADSYLKLISQKHIQFANKIHLRSYFYAVVKNGCFDYLHRYKYRLKVNDHLKQTAPLTENVIERKFQKTELIQLIYKRIDNLPEKMKMVFKLTYLDGRSRTEVAQLLNLSENTIRNTNAAAMKAIRITFSKI